MKVFITLAVLVAALLFVGGLLSYSSTSDVHLHITSKESVSTDGGHEYRIYTEGETFKVADSIVHPRFNSADVYGNLQAGQDYTCEVYGWRIPLFSKFRNILHCWQ